MKKVFLFWISIICLLFHERTVAQTPYDAYMAQFSLLEQYTPSGVLEDRSFFKIILTDSLKPELFRPGAGSLGTPTSFDLLYKYMYWACFNPFQYFQRSPNNLDYLIDSLRYGYNYSNISWPDIMNFENQADVVIGSLAMDYQIMSSDAIETGKIGYDIQARKFYVKTSPYIISDTIWISGVYGQEPYLVHTDTIVPDSIYNIANWKSDEQLFTISALQTEVYVGQDGKVKFYMPDILNINNIQGSNIEVDFDDGIGFVLVNTNSFITRTYTSFGSKTLKARLKNASGQIIGDLPALTQLDLIYSNSVPDTILLSDYRGCVNLNEPLGEAVLSFKYNSASNGKLLKPFILVEGFESIEYDTQNPEYDKRINNGFGLLNWNSFLKGVNNTHYPQMSNLQVAIDSLLLLGYDVGFVDFRSNRAQIQKNANGLISLLTQVNDILKINGSNSGIHLMGASMGGLISRAALVKMENKNCCHGVKAFYSFSTPHKGANIPLAIQRLTYDLGYNYNILGKGDKAKLNYSQVLNSPAARQMLIAHNEVNAHAEHVMFMQFLDSIGFPELTYNVAITDGSLSQFFQKEINEDILTADLLELQNIFNIKMKTKVFIDIYNSQSDEIILMSVEGRSLDVSTSSSSSQWNYRKGKNLVGNLGDLVDFYIVYYTGRTIFFTNKLIHIAALYKYSLMTQTINLSLNITNNIINNYFSSILLDKVLSNRNDNTILGNHQYPHFPYDGLDNAPGDEQNTGKKLEKSLSMLGSVFDLNIFPHHAFVSTISSLNQNGSTRSNVYNNTINNVSSQTFDHVWSKRVDGEFVFLNKRHVSISKGFIDWFHSAVSNIDDDLMKYQNQILLIDYNLALPKEENIDNVLQYFPHKSIPQLTIASGKSLFLNKIGLIGPDNNPRLLVTRPNSHMTTRTRSYRCDSVVVSNYGNLVLGEPLPSQYTNSAEMIVSPGHVLELFPNSITYINQASTLTIETGAVLRVHPGAQIIFGSSDAVLHIKGIVQLVNGATMLLSGPGYMKLDQDPNQVNHPFELWAATQNAGVKFHGGNAQQRLLELVQSVEFSNRIKLDFKLGKLELHPLVQLNIHGPVAFNQLKIQDDFTNSHRGIYLHGQPQVQIKNVNIQLGNPAITSMMLQQRNHLILDQVTLKHNQTAVLTYGGQVEFVSTTFDSNQVGWRGHDMDGVSKIKSCIFDHGNTAIDIIGQSDATLDITQTRIERQQWGIKTFGLMTAKMSCSQLTNNQTALYAGNSQWLMGGRSRNKFNNNAVAIRIEEVDNLFLFEGENDFSGSSLYLTGEFSGLAMNHLYYNPITAAYEINIKDNRIPVVGGNTRISLRDWDGLPVYTYNFTPMPSMMPLCNANQTVAFELYVLQNWPSPTPIITNTGVLQLNEAVLMAKNKIDGDGSQQVSDNLEAIEDFHNIFEQLRNMGNQFEPTGKERVILEIALNGMLEAHNNAYRFELIPRIRAVDGVPKNPYLDNLIEEINYRIDREITAGNIEKELFGLMLSKAQVFRVVEHYDYGLEALADLSQYADDYWSGITTYWTCIFEAEKELIREEISPDMFEERRLECIALAPQYRKANINLTGDPVRAVGKNIQFDLFPNPSKEWVNVSSRTLLGEAQIKLYSGYGQLISTHKWDDLGDVKTLDIHMLKPGVYMLRIISAQHSETIKFVKH
jgi:hypothetical protein